MVPFLYLQLLHWQLVSPAGGVPQPAIEPSAPMSEGREPELPEEPPWEGEFGVGAGSGAGSGAVAAGAVNASIVAAVPAVASAAIAAARLLVRIGPGLGGGVVDEAGRENELADVLVDVAA